ncbi:MAG: hypothetical protein QXF12_02295 [Candidatus Aenigmatarchaeota archaeon]
MIEYRKVYFVPKAYRNKTVRNYSNKAIGEYIRRIPKFVGGAVDRLFKGNKKGKISALSRLIKRSARDLSMFLERVQGTPVFLSKIGYTFYDYMTSVIPVILNDEMYYYVALDISGFTGSEVAKELRAAVEEKYGEPISPEKEIEYKKRIESLMISLKFIYFAVFNAFLSKLISSLVSSQLESVDLNNFDVDTFLDMVEQKTQEVLSKLRFHVFVKDTTEEGETTVKRNIIVSYLVYNMFSYLGKDLLKEHIKINPMQYMNASIAVNKAVNLRFIKLFQKAAFDLIAKVTSEGERLYAVAQTILQAMPSDLAAGATASEFYEESVLPSEMDARTFKRSFRSINPSRKAVMIANKVLEEAKSIARRRGISYYSDNGYILDVAVNRLLRMFSDSFSKEELESAKDEIHVVIDRAEAYGLVNSLSELVAKISQLLLQEEDAKEAESVYKYELKSKEDEDEETDDDTGLLDEYGEDEDETESGKDTEEEGDEEGDEEDDEKDGKKGDEEESDEEDEEENDKEDKEKLAYMRNRHSYYSRKKTSNKRNDDKRRGRYDVSNKSKSNMKDEQYKKYISSRKNYFEKPKKLPKGFAEENINRIVRREKVRRKRKKI